MMVTCSLQHTALHDVIGNVTVIHVVRHYIIVTLLQITAIHCDILQMRYYYLFKNLQC